MILPRDTAIMAIIRCILDETIADLPWFLEQLAAQARLPSITESLGRALFMSWEQVRHLADSGGRFDHWLART